MDSRENRTQIQNYKNVTNHIMHSVIHRDCSHKNNILSSFTYCFSHSCPYNEGQWCPKQLLTFYCTAGKKGGQGHFSKYLLVCSTTSLIALEQGQGEQIMTLLSLSDTEGYEFNQIVISSFGNMAKTNTTIYCVCLCPAALTKLSKFPIQLIL